jgi:APA family basic amino acid/polyamine antiporter
MSMFTNLFTKKPLALLIKDAEEGGGEDLRYTLKRALGPVNLILLGIGATVGAGIFTLTGEAAARWAGPGVVYSFAIGGVLCALAGLCYAEMASMVPISGSAYSYSYVTMGELVAWIIGWDLVLEYAFSAVAVAVSWSGYLRSLLVDTLHIPFPDWAMRLTQSPWEPTPITLADGSTATGLWNMPASVISLLVALVLFRGIKESALLNNIIVVIKVGVVLVFITLGWAVIDPANWIANPSASGLASLVPPRGMAPHGAEMVESFGWPGVFTGAGLLFFAYIGFDSVSTTAQECRNPRRDLPIGILGTMVACTVLYILMALVLTGVVHYTDLGVSDPIAVGVDHIGERRGWSESLTLVFGVLVKAGVLAGLASVILMSMLGQTRIFYTMSRDGLLPWFHRVHEKHQTPHYATIITGVASAALAGFLPMIVVGELVSIGTLLAFMLVCVAVPILRVTNPEAPRSFRTPAAWVVAPLGAGACIWVMSNLPLDTWLRLLVWLALGFVIYFAYGYRHSRLHRR